MMPDSPASLQDALVWLQRTGEVGRIVHVFSVHPFKGDVVVLVGERQERCSVDEVDKVET